MSGKSDHPQLPGPSGKKVVTFTNFFVLLGVILFVASGMLRVWIFAAKDTVVAGAPYFEQAKEEFTNFNPGVPGLSFVWNGKEHKIWGPVEPGKDWSALTGIEYAGGSGNDEGGSNSQPSDGAEEIPPQTPPENEDPNTTFQRYQQQFVALVGGVPGAPDFSMLSATNVQTARQLIANMKATGIDLVTPQNWNDQMEAKVRSNYEYCFQVQDLTCVRNWAPVQTVTVENPPGLRDWLTLVIADVNAVNDLVDSAKNTNASEIMDELVTQLFEQARVQRIQTGCNALGKEEPAGIALDVQWCLSGKTVKVWIEEPNSGWNLVPDEIGGQAGVLGEGDVVVFIDENGNQFRVTAEVAIEAVPGLDFGAHDKFVEFPLQPTLWNTATNPWTPGQPIP